MKWSWKIATMKGISMRLHGTMIVFLAWIGVANWQIKWRPLSGGIALVFVIVCEQAMP